ncbi:MAG: hypothetical protein HFF17_07085 [Oscillospiraceae bacterium]|nr:hypothetical protein [Oscillospiraceae bacterium]
MYNKSKSSNQEKIQAALDRIDNAVENINTDADWLAFLSFSSKFYNYSARNTLLIYAQNPQASYVKGFKAWNQLGRYVKKGAKGLAILAPCIKKVEEFTEPENKAEYQDAEAEKVTKKVVTGFKLTYVFDIADTDGSDEQLPVLVKGLTGNTGQDMRLGLDTPRCSTGYIKSRLTDKNELKAVADTVQKVTSAILSNLASAGIAAFVDLKDE